MGRSRGASMTKIHALVDGLGLPIGLHLPKGQTSDRSEAEELLAAVPKGSTFLVEQGL